MTLRKRQNQRQPLVNITNVNYADDVAILFDSLVGVTKQLHSLEKAAASIGLFVNVKKTKFVDLFTYLGSAIECPEKDFNIRIGKAWSTLRKLTIISKRIISKKDSFVL